MLPLPCTIQVKLGLASLLLIISLKYYLYEHLGGAFFAPNLPRPLLLTAEVLYTSLALLVCLLIVRDLLLALLALARLCGAGMYLPLAPAAQALCLSLVALGLTSFGVWQSVRVPSVRTVEITFQDLPAQLDGISVVQLSDLHIGPLLKKSWLEAVVNKANALQPDIVVITGDMIDGTPTSLRDEISPLAHLHARNGVYGITGNHEYIYGAEAWVAVFKKLGTDMLCNEHRALKIKDTQLVIAGVTDSAASRRAGLPGPDLHKALAGAPDAFRILLAHQPRGAHQNRDVALQLSGHTHGGLIPVLRTVVAAFNDGFVNGLYDLGDRKLYVNPGTGLWNGFSCRLGVPSEITHIILRTQPR